MSQIGNYKLLDVHLGEGAFSKVQLATHLVIGKKVAVKIIRLDNMKDAYAEKNLQREAKIMTQLSHPNIITLHEVCAYKNLYCLVLDYCPGGSLCDLLSRYKDGLGETLCRRLFKQILDGVEYLHSRHVVHRDIKLDNILTNQEGDHILIGDFGLSNICLPGRLLQTHCGSPEYAAPELFMRGKDFTKEVDVWSCGVLLYTLLTYQLPFSRGKNEGDLKELRRRVRVGLTDEHHQKLLDVGLSDECRVLLHQILAVGVDVKLRPSLRQIQLSPWCCNEPGYVGPSDLSFEHQLEVAKVIKTKLSLTKWSPHNILTYVNSSRGKLGKTAGCFSLLAQDLQLKLARRQEMSITSQFQVQAKLLKSPIRAPAVKQRRKKFLTSRASERSSRTAGVGRDEKLRHRKFTESSTMTGRKTAEESKKMRERGAPKEEMSANLNTCQDIEQDDDSEEEVILCDPMSAISCSTKKRRRDSFVYDDQGQSLSGRKVWNGRSRATPNMFDRKPFKYIENC